MPPQRKTAGGDGTAGAAARTGRAELQQQQQHAADMVLPLLLQHDSIRTQLPLACKLLCCSKWLAAAVAEHSAGQLAMPWFHSLEEAQQAAPWLRKHARLVRSLYLQSYDIAAAGILPALVAAGPNTLQLQSLRAYGAPTALPLLEQLPASRLTHLDWSVDEEQLQPGDRPAFVARVSAALGRLTALRILGLRRELEDWPAHPRELSGLSALTQLTSLCFGGTASDLQHAPPQLLDLYLGNVVHSELDSYDIYGEKALQPLDLRRLSAVTALDCNWLGEGDALPPNLLQLRVRDFRNEHRPLLGLQQLQQLQQLQLRFRRGTDITADQLRSLSRLTSLSLDYFSVGASAEPASAGAWPALPLQQLELVQASLSAPVCQHLAQLSGLTSLRLHWCRLPGPDSAQQLAAALRQLSGLQQLQLSGPQLAARGNTAAPGSNTTTEPSQGMQQLAQAVGSLQRLRELDISGFPQLVAAVAGATNTLTGLVVTKLSFARCHLPDGAVTAIVSQLPGLQRLDCSDAVGPPASLVTDAALPAIGRLQQLTSLSLCYTCVSDAGMSHLAGLTRLRKLNLCGTAVTDAGMHHLTGLARLQELSAPFCVSSHQQRWLKQQLPKLVLQFSCN